MHLLTHGQCPLGLLWHCFISTKEGRSAGFPHGLQGRSSARWGSWAPPLCGDWTLTAVWQGLESRLLVQPIQMMGEGVEKWTVFSVTLSAIESYYFLSNEDAPFLIFLFFCFFVFLVHASGVSRLLSFFSCKSGIYESKENPGNPPPCHWLGLHIPSLSAVYFTLQSLFMLVSYIIFGGFSCTYLDV